MLDFSPVGEPTATVVIVGLRRAPSLIDCLNSLAANVSEVSYEVQVVLCDPTDQVRADLERAVKGIGISVFRANLGFARAANFGASRGRAPYIVLLNDDCQVRPGWLESLVDTVERRPTCGIVCGRYIHPDGTLQEAGSVVWNDGTTAAIGDGQSPDYMEFERQIDYGSGGSTLVRREVWDLLGGMSEEYYPAYYEDVDFCLSAAQQGWETWYQPDSVVEHRRSSSTEPGIRAFLMSHGRERFDNRWEDFISTCEPRGAIERAVWRAMNSPLRVLVIDDQIPEPERGAGFGRMLDTVVFLTRDRGLQVSFHPRMPIGPPKFPVRSVRVVWDLPDHLMTDGVHYDVVIVSRPHNAEIYRPVLDQHLPGVPIIYDAEALFYRRLDLQAQVAAEADREAIVTQARDMRELETEIFDWADRVVCISEVERQAAAALTDTPIDVVSPLLRTPTPTPAGFRDRRGIGLVAGWSAGPGSPNSDGLLWFAHEVWPRIKTQDPSLTLRVTGLNPPSDVRWLAGDGITFVGQIADLADFYNSIRVAISPTRFGAGVKIKSVEAVQYAVPAVCTTEAASGLPGDIGRAAWVTDCPADFADAVVKLACNEGIWDRQRSMCLRAGQEPEGDQGESADRWPDIVREVASVTRKVVVAKH